MNMKGALPLLILVLLNQGDKHGYDLAKQLRCLSNNLLEFKEGALYPTLARLETDGLLTSYTQEHQGRLRRYYQITDAGRQEKIEQQQSWVKYSQAINVILDSQAKE